jgi:hypothetical protein
MKNRNSNLCWCHKILHRTRISDPPYKSLKLYYHVCNLIYGRYNQLYFLHHDIICEMLDLLSTSK